MLLLLGKYVKVTIVIIKVGVALDFLVIVGYPMVVLIAPHVVVIDVAIVVVIVIWCCCCSSRQRFVVLFQTDFGITDSCFT
jgi:hypothetical protein